MRSLLFIPADDEKKLGKGLATGADALILDLEDAVSLPRKAAARALAAQYIADTRPHEGRPRIYVRINALDTELWQDDVSSVAGMRPDGILLPKARSGEDVHKLSIALNHEEERSGAPMGATRIVALVTETPISLLQLQTYVGLELAAGGPDLGRGRPLGGARRPQQPRGRRPRLDLALPPGARSHPVRRGRCRRAGDRHRVRQLPRRGGPAAGVPLSGA